MPSLNRGGSSEQEPNPSARRGPLLLPEDRSDCKVLLRVHAAHLARSVVEVVVGVQRLPLLGRRQLAALSLKARHRGRIGMLRLRKGAEMVFDVSLRAKQPLLL